jgi:PAS domain S-box-containing protein
MNPDTRINLIALLLSGGLSAMLAGVMRWYATPHTQAHYRHWAAAWQAQGAYYVVGALAFSLAVMGVGAPSLRLGLSFATQVANTLAAALLVIGAVGFVKRQPVDQRTLRWALVIAVLLGAVVAFFGAARGASVGRASYRSFITAASFIGSGIVIWRARVTAERPARLLSLALVAFGLAHLHYLTYWMLRLAGRAPDYSLVWFTILDLLWLAGIAVSMSAMAFADERVAGAHALREREREFRQMIEHSSDLITVLDEARVIRYVSPSALRILGWGDEAVGRAVVEFVHPDDQPSLAERIRQEDPGDTPFTVRVRSKAGNWTRLEAVSRRWKDEAGRATVIVNARDVAERERLEASLRESQKLESVGRLAGGVAHDLNNILMVIGSQAQMALEDAPDELRDALREITGATDRAADLTRQLLTFARRQVVAPRVIDASEAVTRMARMAARLVPASIDFRLVPSAADHFVLADPVQVEQVVMNLVVNARDAITERGQIELSVGEQEVAAGEEPGIAAGRFVTIRVRDTGGGIPEAARPHLFEPFFTTKALGEGTGLGLATSYGIVRQAGGFIRVDSVLGEGSTFTVFLPAADPEAVPRQADEPPLPRANGELVLVVEDDAAVRALEVRALERAGFQVLEASDGGEALTRYASRADIQVVVSDVVMPRIGGVELSRRLRNADPSLGVLLLSGYPGEGGFLSTLPAGAAFLQKPVAPGELVRQVHSLTVTRGLASHGLASRRPAPVRGAAAAGGPATGA